MNSEHTSKQCGWNFLGQLIERCQPSASRFDSEYAESVSQRGGTDMSSGAVAGEQPQGGQLLGDTEAPTIGEGLHEGGKRFSEFKEVGTGKRFSEFKEVGTEAQRDAFPGMPHVPGGECDDTTEWLCVKSHQGARDPVNRIEGIVSHQALGDPPTFL